MIIEFHKTDELVKTPVRSNPSDAGLDVFAFLDKDMTILPLQSQLIPTGLKFGVPHGYMLQVMNRSSVASSLSLIVGAHVIDSGYDGEVFINIHNVGQVPKTVINGQKIAQLVMIPVIPFRAYELQQDSLYNSNITISDRGDGALGSTGS